MAREPWTVGIVSTNRYGRMKLYVTDQAQAQLTRIGRAGHRAIVFLELPEGISRARAADRLWHTEEFIGWCRESGYSVDQLTSWLAQTAAGELA